MPAWLFAIILFGVAAPWVVATHQAVALEKVARPQSQRGWLGIVMVEREGGLVVVGEVLRTSPAEIARIQPGDIILRVDGVAVHAAADTARLVGQRGAGSTVKITFSRDGREQTVNVVLAPYPSHEQLLIRQFVGKPAPSLVGIVTREGAAGPTIESLRGKVVVLDFWASYCTACRAAAASLNRTHDRGVGRGVSVIGISGEGPNAMARGVQQFGMRYPNYSDRDGSVSRLYQARELPTVVVIDRKGIVRDISTGFSQTRMRQIDELVDRLLAESASGS